MDVATFFSAAQDYGFTDSSNATLLRALQGSVDAIERMRPWPFLEASTDLDFAGASSTSSTSLTQLRAVLRATVKATGARLMASRLDAMEDIFRGNYTAAGTPIYYYFQAGIVNFWPLPPVGTAVVKLRYLQWSPRLTETSPESAFLIPARHHEAVLFGMLRRLYDQQDDPELAATFASQHDELVAKMAEDAFMQQYDRPDLIELTDLDF